MPANNKTRYAILGVLSIKQGTGYDIKKFCDEGITYFWNENFGHIYPVLKQMEKDGEIKKTVQQDEGKRTKNVFSVTPKGNEELIEWLMQPTGESPARLELLLKLTFARNIPAQKVIEEMERVKSNHIHRLEQFEMKEKQFSSDEQVRMDPGYPYWLATLHYGIYDAEFRIRWCEETIENIKKQEELLLLKHRSNSDS
jgi:DNA-binding PadR family transcriptional regulator